jgi:hypothetical protein
MYVERTFVVARSSPARKRRKMGRPDAIGIL